MRGTHHSLWSCFYSVLLPWPYSSRHYTHLRPRSTLFSSDTLFFFSAPSLLGHCSSLFYLCWPSTPLQDAEYQPLWYFRSQFSHDLCLQKLAFSLSSQKVKLTIKNEYKVEEHCDRHCGLLNQWPFPLLFAMYILKFFTLDFFFNSSRKRQVLLRRLNLSPEWRWMCCVNKQSEDAS